MSSTVAMPYTDFEPPRLIQETPLLQARAINKSYGNLIAVQDVGVNLYRGEVLGVVGESGSGKSTLLRLLNLQEEADSGTFNLALEGYQNKNLFELNRFAKREVQTKHIGIVYQNPNLGLRMRASSSGNVAERLIISGERRYSTLREAASNSLAASEFPLERMDDLPSKLSGGMQQRVQLAKAIALKPELLLLDEPTTGLDVSVQALVLDTLKRLQRELKVAMIIVSHDLGVIRTLADRIMVMRYGQVVELGLADQVLEDPQHAYTQQLVHAKL